MNEVTAMDGVWLIGIGIGGMLGSKKVSGENFTEAGVKRPSLMLRAFRFRSYERKN